MDSSLNGFIQEECHKDIDQQYTNDGRQYFCKQKGNNITKVSLSFLTYIYIHII